MTHPVWLELYAAFALGSCALGFAGKGWRWLRARRRPIPAAVATIDAAAPIALGPATWRFFTRPARWFHCRASRLWTCGYLLYHAAILMVVAGYAASALVLAGSLLAGRPIPDYSTGLEGPSGRLPANLLALVFGNAEPIPSAYLFGRAASAFRSLAACELPLAVAGNLCLLLTVIRRRGGAVLHGLDPAAREVRLAGSFSAEKLAVRLLILSIIGAELVGRCGWVPGIAYFHALLGLTLIALLPWTYLSHIPLAPLAVWLGIQRRRRNAVA